MMEVVYKNISVPFHDDFGFVQFGKTHSPPSFLLLSILALLGKKLLICIGNVLCHAAVRLE